MTNPPKAPWIAWVDDESASGDVAEIYSRWRQANPDRQQMPDILKCFSARPDVLKSMLQLCYPLQFAAGFLSRRQKEMIATYVSGLNQCPY